MHSSHLWLLKGPLRKDPVLTLRQDLFLVAEVGSEKSSNGF